MLGLDYDEKLGIQATNPSHTSLAIILLVLVIAGCAYFIFGCTADWVVLGGLALDILGALGIAILEFPQVAHYCYANRLETFWHDLLGEGYPSVNENQARFLTEVLYPESEPPTDPSYEFIGGDEETADRLRIDGDGEKPDTPTIEIVQQRLRQEIQRETSSVRRIGAYLLITGFTLQFFGLLLDPPSFEMILQALGSPGTC